MVICLYLFVLAGALSTLSTVLLPFLLEEKTWHDLKATFTSEKG